jgi:hypothetical protein
MNKLTSTILALATLGLGATSAFAEDANKPNYNLVGLQYVYNRLDTSSEENTDGNAFLNDAYAVEASYGLFDRVLFRGSFYDGEGDLNSDTEIRLKTTEIGISALNIDDETVGIDGGLLWRKDDFSCNGDVGCKDQDLKGVGLGFGVRANIFENHEIGARVGMYFGDFDDSPGFQLNYAWNLFDHWAITAGYEYMDVSLDGKDDDEFEYTNNKLTLGGRFYF